MNLRLSAAFLAFVLLASPASAQLFEAGFNITTAQWSEFEGTDYGIGGRFTVKPLRFIGFDADFAWYPGDFPDEIEFSGTRFEGLFGVTLGPQLGGLRPFVKTAYGFLQTTDAPAPIACPAIFPPPILCVMTEGQTLPAFEIGGGLQFDVGGSGFVRVDFGSRMLNYPGPAIDTEGEARQDNFWGARSRLSFGGGIKF